MKSARELFEELGYTLFLEDNETLIYRHKNDYVDNSITFHLGNYFPMCYDVSFVDWIDNSTIDDWLPMSEREENLKHCAKYGHWQKVEYGINISLHNAIDQQINELGWNDTTLNLDVKLDGKKVMEAIERTDKNGIMD